MNVTLYENLTTSMEEDDEGFEDILTKTPVKVIFTLLYCLLIVCSLFGNSLLLFFMVNQKRHSHMSRVFYGNLAVTDLLETLFVIIPSLLTHIHLVNGGLFYCKITRLVSNTIYLVCAFILTAIYLEKYIRFRCIKLLVMLVIWCIGVIYALPIVYFSTVLSSSGLTICYVSKQFILAKWYIWVERSLYISILVLVLLFVAIEMTKVGKLRGKWGRQESLNGLLGNETELMEHNHYLNVNNSTEKTESPAVISIDDLFDSTDHNHNSHTYKPSTEEQIRNLKLLGSIVLSHLLAKLPHLTMSLLAIFHIYDSMDSNYLLYKQLTLFITYVPTVMASIFYAVFKHEFRDFIKKSYSRIIYKLCKHKTNS